GEDAPHERELPRRPARPGDRARLPRPGRPGAARRAAPYLPRGGRARRPAHQRPPLRRAALRGRGGGRVRGAPRRHPRPSQQDRPAAGRRVPRPHGRTDAGAVMEHGILTDRAGTAPAYAAGADYVEPTVLGNLLVQEADGTWREAPLADAWQPAPSFAAADLGLADPSADPGRLEHHLRLVMTAAARRARPGATIVLGSGAARRTPEGVDPAAARAQLARSVRLARDLAVEHGLEAI